MFNLRLAVVGWGLSLLAVAPVAAQPLYYATTSATLGLNTLDSAATNGSSHTGLLTASGAGGNQISHCTSVAADGLNGKLFFLDGPGDSLWSVNLDGSSPTLIKTGLTGSPTDLALDVWNKKVYYATSSSQQTGNTVQQVDYTGANNTVVFSATGVSPGNGVSRCTALALDRVNSRIFLADAGTQKIWSMNLTGGGLSMLAATTNNVPVGLALDATHQEVYFAASSPVSGYNVIERVSYSGAGLTTIFTAAGSVQRCTALDVDPANGLIYFSDAAAGTLWRVPLAGGSATTVLSGLPATARKVRWFGGLLSRPMPGLVGFKPSGTNLVFNATNGSSGGTYYMLTSTNIATPLSQWLPVLTNVLGADGNFTLTATNGFNPQIPRRFYILRVE